MVYFATNDLIDFDDGSLMIMSNEFPLFDSTMTSKAITTNSGSDVLMDKTLDTDTNIIWIHFVSQWNNSGGTGIFSYDNDWLRVRDLDGNRVAGLYRGVTGSNSFSTRAQSASIVASPSALGVPTSRTTWDICVDMTGANIVVTTYINGVLAHTVSVAKGTRKNIKKVEWWINGMRYNGTNLYVSEFILSQTSTIGQRVATLRANTNGSLTGMSGNVSDLDVVGEGLGLTSNAPNQRHTWNPTAYAGPSKPIAAVQVSMAAERSGGSPSVIAPFFRKAGLNYDGLNVAVGATMKSRQVWLTNPITGLPWSISDLTGLEIGLKSGA